VPRKFAAKIAKIAKKREFRAASPPLIRTENVVEG
jgi:hypothetical protein